MICLSKADEGAFRHLSYNQSPRPLAAEHTTRQDLNGISNLREHVASDQDDDGGGGTLNPAESDKKWYRQGRSPGPGDPASGDAGRWFCGPSSRLMVAVGGDGQRCPFSVTSQACLARLWGWVTWTASVLLVSFALTAAMSIYNGTGRDAAATLINTVDPPSTSGPLVKSQEPPVHSLQKRSTCASSSISGAVYNTGLHVGALLIVWFVSTLACAFPLLAKKFPGLHIPQRFFFVVRHFGTGVLIATAFVHLLPTAFISLGDPCLGDFWIKDYPAMPGAIALASIFFVTVIEMVFHPARRCGSSPSASSDQSDEQSEKDSDESTGPRNGPVLMRDMAPPRARSSSVGHGLNRLPTLSSVGPSQRDMETKRAAESQQTDPETAESLSQPSSDLKLRKERLQCVLLELGILFHSVFIGMALSVSVGNEFVVLLIAIVFHQTFEGLALGSRIATVKWPKSNKQPWLMAFAYGCTTPIGQALGIATHTLYTPDSEVGLTVVGVMNSISAGLLTFASLVELMSEDFLSDESWKYLRGRKRVVACFLVFLGAFCMSLVGAWA
ncbi:Zinc-regulated transporter-like protein [Hapsidospora chrysogenum ATCC 11550]|uniref:Zinc-regulated transporter-like protein n=1 Tax=Hapsidospora chrysogenum (strain ATCC 11550 / CBS 779.69 / DSM 880 / IAM 14645 / JCM 23072 / IMI 49137) TaxID=857340 RepID=A0A086T543_HAPC1|nr:Zinc-regulated transporter-like protein [Hapsidospora chrysogenum ATCC 11550]